LSNYSQIIASISWLDVLFVLIFVGMIYRGLRSGIGSQILSLIGWFIVIFFSVGYYSVLSTSIFGFMQRTWSRSSSYTMIIGVGFIVIKLLEMVFRDPASDKAFARVACTILASLRAAIVAGLISIQLLLMPVPDMNKMATKGSKLAMYFVNLDVSVYSGITKVLSSVKRRDRIDIIDELRNPN